MNQLAAHHEAARSRSTCDSRPPEHDGRPSGVADPSTANRVGPPPRHKLALVTWIGAYSVITAILAVLGPLMSTWPLPLRTLLLSVLMVLTLTWAVLPLLNRAFRGWLTG